MRSESREMPHALPERGQIAVADTWDTSGLFPSAAAWHRACAEVRAALRELASFAGRLGEGPDLLVDFLRQREAVEHTLGRLQLFTLLETSVDSADEPAAARSDQGSALQAEAAATLAFAHPELALVGFDTLRRWVAADQRLRHYVHWLDRLERHAPHRRSAEVEGLLEAVTDPLRTPRTAHGVLADAELRFEPALDAGGAPHEVAQSTYQELLQSPDRTLREHAFRSYADAYRAHRRTLATLLGGGVKRDACLARARGYETSLEAALLPVDVPPQVFHNVIASFRDHVGVWHRYWRLRRRALGVDRLRDHDTRAVLAPRIDVPYRTAVDWLCEGLRPLGDDYVGRLRRGALEERWVDVYPNRGKRLGAFSYGPPGTHPFVFLSYHDGLPSLSTLAHEFGHALHYQRSAERQPYVYAACGMFVAEVASNTNQALCRGHLLEQNPDPAFQIAVLEEAIGNFHRYLLVMPTLSRLELELHERVERGEPLTADGLTNLTAELLAEAYGDEVAMDRERSGMLWAQFHTHLYTGFHPFNYTTGIAAAQLIASAIRAEGRPAVDRYLAFLGAGSSGYPLDVLGLTGVDLSQRAPIDHAYQVLEGYVARLEALLAA
ncbi:MAG: M3 family oligoendopeptidase [Candidatus Dormiibacterota bacterium]